MDQHKTDQSQSYQDFHDKKHNVQDLHKSPAWRNRVFTLPGDYIGKAQQEELCSTLLHV
jgi:hypothetical protein